MRTLTQLGTSFTPIPLLLLFTPSLRFHSTHNRSLSDLTMGQSVRAPRIREGLRASRMQRCTYHTAPLHLPFLPPPRSSISFSLVARVQRVKNRKIKSGETTRKHRSPNQNSELCPLRYLRPASRSTCSLSPGPSCPLEPFSTLNTSKSSSIRPSLAFHRIRIATARKFTNQLAPPSSTSFT